MAAISRSTKLSPALADAAELRARNLGYASWNAYVKALIRYDLMVQGEHTVTRPISHLRLDQQDKIDGELLQLTRQGVGVRGQWLEKAIERIAGEEKVEEAKASIIAVLAS
jgi:hypothetical protein